MYDQVLNKVKFTEEFSKKGYSVEEIEKAFSRLEKLFKVCLLQEAFSRLEKGEQTVLSQGIDFKKPDEVQKFLDNVNQFLTNNPGKVNREEVVPAAVKGAFSSFKELSGLLKQK